MTCLPAMFVSFVCNLSQAFSAITVFFVMLFGIRMIPYGSRYLAEAIVALRRIQALLVLKEFDHVIPIPADHSLAVQLRKATLVWEKSNQVVTVINLTCSCR
jgi:hypothetical protein